MISSVRYFFQSWNFTVSLGDFFATNVSPLWSQRLCRTCGHLARNQVRICGVLSAFSIFSSLGVLGSLCSLAASGSAGGSAPLGGVRVGLSSMIAGATVSFGRIRRNLNGLSGRGRCSSRRRRRGCCLYRSDRGILAWTRISSRLCDPNAASRGFSTTRKLPVEDPDSRAARAGDWRSAQPREWSAPPYRRVDVPGGLAFITSSKPACRAIRRNAFRRDRPACSSGLARPPSVLEALLDLAAARNRIGRGQR